MKILEYAGPFVLVGLVAVLSLMAYKTMPCTTCLNNGAMKLVQLNADAPDEGRAIVETFIADRHWIKYRCISKMFVKPSKNGRRV